jgi:hypothetical protein
MKVGITAVVGNGTVGITAGSVTRSTGRSAACVGTNGVGVGDIAPHATNSHTENSKRENGRLPAVQFIPTKVY